jgi:integrase
VKDKRLRAPSSRTLRQEVEDWLAGARTGEIRNKREQPYKPSVVREYERALRLRVLPDLSDRKLADIDLADLLDLKEHLQGSGLSDSTIRNTFVPLQAIYRRARRNGTVALNPTLDLGLPTAGTRDRAATPQQAAELLAALSDSTALERAIWATAFYAGLRRGEQRALRVRNVDLDAATIDVEHGWDAKEGQVDTKSRAGVRRVFLLDVLRPYLEPQVKGRSADELVFGHRKAPFEPRAVARKAERAWAAYSVGAFIRGEPSAFEPFTLHEARHSFATWMDHAGISEARCDRYMGHARSGVAGRYRHLLPAQIAEDAAKLDTYLTGATAGTVVPLAAAQ